MKRKAKYRHEKFAQRKKDLDKHLLTLTKLSLRFQFDSQIFTFCQLLGKTN